MEQIKVGDIVRVSEDAPKVYAKGWDCDWYNRDSTVEDVDGDSAEIEQDSVYCSMAIPTKYLIKVNAEPKVKSNESPYAKFDKFGRKRK